MGEQVRFGLWRHEDSIGNSVEHTYALAFYLFNNNINPAEVEFLVEHEWQKYFVSCIQGVKEENIKFFSCSPKTPEGRQKYCDVYMPCVYCGKDGYKSYNSNWQYINSQDVSNVTLKFEDKSYVNKFDLPKNAVVLFHRENSGWHDNKNRSVIEKQRFISNIDTFHDLAKFYADSGHKVVKIGDMLQKPLPGQYTKFKHGVQHEHPNIIDFTKYIGQDLQPLWTLEDYLFLLQNCKIFISCDAGIWPMAGAMKKKMVFCNAVATGAKYKVTSTHIDKQYLEPVKPHYSLWLPRETTKVLLKSIWYHRLVLKYSDNTFEEIIKAAGDLLDD